MVTLVPGGAIRVNAGGPAYTDPAGQVWSDTGATGGSASSTASNITGTTTVPLYQTARQGQAFGYQFAVPNGKYTVNLKFAELSYTAAGNRVFDVMINGSKLLSKFDIAAQAGGETQGCGSQLPGGCGRRADHGATVPHGGQPHAERAGDPAAAGRGRHHGPHRFDQRSHGRGRRFPAVSH